MAEVEIRPLNFRTVAISESCVRQQPESELTECCDGIRGCYSKRVTPSREGEAGCRGTNSSNQGPCKRRCVNSKNCIGTCCRIKGVPHLNFLTRVGTPSIRFVQVHVLFIAVVVVYGMKIKLERNRLFSQSWPRLMGLAFGKDHPMANRVLKALNLVDADFGDFPWDDEEPQQARNASASSRPARETSSADDALMTDATWIAKDLADTRGYRWEMPLNRVVPGHSLFYSSDRDKRLSSDDESDDLSEVDDSHFWVGQQRTGEAAGNDNGSRPDFAVITNPRIGLDDCDEEEGVEGHGSESCKRNSLAKFRTSLEKVAAVNPKKLFIVGDLLRRPASKVFGEKESVVLLLHEALEAALGDETAVYMVPGALDVGKPPSKSSLHSYEQMFGKSYFAVQDDSSMLHVVLNASLFLDPSDAPELAAEQESWLENLVTAVEEEQSTLTKVVVFSQLPIFFPPPAREDGKDALPLSSSEENIRKLIERLRRRVEVLLVHNGLPGKEEHLVVTSGASAAGQNMQTLLAGSGRCVVGFTRDHLREFCSSRSLQVAV